MKTIDINGFQRVACPYQTKIRLLSDKTDHIAGVGDYWCKGYCEGFVSMKNNMIQCKMDEIKRCENIKRYNTICYFLNKGIKKIVRKIFNI